MSEPFVGEIRCFSFPFAPRGWVLCNGQTLPINQNQMLFAILGTTYGGDGVTTFAVPDMRGRAPVHTGNGVTLGQKAGEEAHTLTINEMPAHVHQVTGSTQTVNVKTAVGNVWANSDTNPYAPQGNTLMSQQALSTSGSSQAHPNMQPYTVMNYCMATTGLFPTQN